MPVLDNSTYRRPAWLFNRHLETMVPSLFRKIKLNIAPVRLEIPTPDDDVLELDWYKTNGDKLMIISHGLEGDSRRPYVLGLARKFLSEGWNVMAWNYRGCGQKLNRTKLFYHSGATYDLETIVNFGIQSGFETIAMTGVSLGGNLTLKYLGERDLPSQIKCAAVFSVPIDLAGCSMEIDKPHNALYAKRFLKSLKLKVAAKNELISGLFDMSTIQNLKSIYEFDDVVTAPLHGFEGADDYYQKSSSIHYIKGVKVPTLVVNAANDPFLSTSCFDTTNFESSDAVYFEIPKFGGHVGFSTFGNGGTYWSEARAYEFVSVHIK